jgi:hypothetical protein
MLSIILSVILGSVSSSTIVPVYIENGIPKIRLMPTLDTGDIGVPELYIVSLWDDTTIIHDRYLGNQANFFSVLGEGNTILETLQVRGLPTDYNEDDDASPVVIGMSPSAPIYDQFVNGIMLVPSRIGGGNEAEDFSQMAMVLNPENPAIFCQENSLFYASNHSPFFFVVSAKSVVSPPDQIIIDTDQTTHLYTIESSQEFDLLPSSIYDQLLS